MRVLISGVPALAALLFLRAVKVDAEDERNNNQYYDYACDSSSVSYDLAVSKLTPNQFHKVCSKQQSSGKAFGQPQCGDGTSFGFFFSRPLQKKENSERILIEFMGGGACFDQGSCAEMGDYLTFPYKFNDFVGLSCSEIAQGVENGDDGEDKFPINMLCAKQIGDVDFTTYNTIIIPYCTQDVHMGDNEMTYYNNDGDESLTVYHKGAHNMMSVLRWIFKNFKKPTHIALTGCSAGGTVLPVAYDLINSHYNTFGVRAVQINTVSDSPVYLTPQWFLDKSIDNWNPWPIMKRIGFNYNKWKSSTDYPTKVWDHVLRRGSNRDRWGIVTHTQDETSQAYYEWMSGAYADDDDGGGRNLEGDDAVSSQWWYELSTSIATIEKKHHNVKDWYIEEDGHCSFGLYYPLQTDGFASWAGNIFVENKILGHTAPSVPLFLTAMIAAALLALGIFFSTSKKREIELDGGDLLKNKDQTPKRSLGSLLMVWLAGLGTVPYTAGYALALSFYFWAMIIKEGFAHPVNNPSLGPSAIALSSFGINNPSLIVYKSQLFRLITSNFLCSGILTYLMTMICLWFYTRKIEKMIGKHFMLVTALIMLGPNLIYALLCSGASCSTMSFVLGHLAFNIMALRATKEATCSMYTVLIVFFAFAAAIFSFNNWFMLLTAILLGGGIRFLFEISEGGHSENDSADGFTEFYKAPTEFTLKKKRMLPLLVVYGLIFFILLLRLRQPNELYLQPFYTGCELKYTNDFDDLAGEFYDNGGNGEGKDDEDDKRRELGGSGDENQYESSSLCAEFCVPHLACKFAAMGARQLGVPIYQGSCTDQGYNEHVADKTFRQMSYSLDVEVYSKYSYNNNDDDEDNKDR